MNEELLAAYRDAIQSAEDTGELDGVVGGLPNEEYEEALAEDIEGRREELKSERIDPDSMTRAEMVDLLENRPELRSAASDFLEGAETEDENRKPDPGSPPNPTRDEGQPDPGSSDAETNDEGSDGLTGDIADAEHDWTVGGDRDLETTGDTSDDWDGDAAYSEILSWAEDEDGNVDQSKAKRGFAVYDSNADGDAQADYKGPFATVDDGTLKADMAGVDALDSMVGQMDISEDKKDSVQNLVDSYKDDSEDDQVQDDADEPDLVIDDEIEDKVDYEDGELSLEAELVTDTALNTLIDTAERLGVEVEEDPDPEALVTAINQRASKVDSGSTTDRSTPDARSLFRRLEDHGTRL